ncbi:MAG TPA: aminotransferase class V-fold PLP-dependent enzyme, partial [Chitinophaga sp.]|nr:aminotransferase class V-fold PLP-dependent enzyme [Chitinophaga sp.]
MNTNINNTGLPDEAALEKLANELFYQADAGNGIPGQEVVAQQAIPPSVAGSGQSPAGILHGNNINIDNPQTGFPDKNLQDINSSSIAGDSLFSPALRLKEYLPYETDPAHLFNLQAILSLIPVDNGTGLQLPGTVDRALEDVPAYYFLESKPALVSSWGFDANTVKKDFPILSERVNGKPLVWLDNAATTQKPKQVIDRISHYYQHENSNIHRAAHELAARATDAYEDARKKVQTFINAGSPNEIVFVRGTTEGINLVAKSWGEQYLQPGDEIIITHLEHHANIVPWQ